MAGTHKTEDSESFDNDENTDNKNTSDKETNAKLASLNQSEISSFESAINDVEEFLQSFETKNRCSNRGCI